MLITAINDTLPPNNSSGQSVDTKINTEEFGQVMAAAQVLIMPGAYARPQTQEESGAAKPSSAGTDSLELFASFFPGGVKENGAVQKPLVGLQGLNPPADPAVNDSEKGIDQMPEVAELSPGMQATQTVMAAQNQENLLNMAVTITEKSVPQLSRAAQNTGQMTMVKTGPNQAVENGVKKGSAPVFEQKNTNVFLVDEGSQEVVSGQQAVSGVSLSGNDFLATQTENSNISETNMSFKTYGPDKIEPLKSGSGAELSCSVESPPQPYAIPAENILSAAGSAESPKGVALPDLKERLVQEIKNVLNTGKGERQRQVQLKLEPEHLGRLTIQLFFGRDELSAHFYTGNNHVKEILEGSLQQLRDSLSQQELKLNEALVFAGDDGRGGGTGRSFEERNGQASLAHNGYYNSMNKDERVEPVHLLTVTTDAARVNYLI